MMICPPKFMLLNFVFSSLTVKNNQDEGRKHPAPSDRKVLLKGDRDGRPYKAVTMRLSLAN